MQGYRRKKVVIGKPFMYGSLTDSAFVPCCDIVLVVCHTLPNPHLVIRHFGNIVSPLYLNIKTRSFVNIPTVAGNARGS